MGNSNCINAQIIEVIKVITTKGSGSSKDDPIREVIQYWTKEGQLLFSE